MNIKYVNGDALIPQGEGKKYIIHICNNVGGWGRGFVLALSRKWKLPETVYRQFKKNYIMGSIQVVEVESDITVINMICQDGYLSPSNPTPLKYTALQEALDKVYTNIKETAIEENISIHAPKIGAKLAGGDWGVISKMLERTFCENNIPVTIYLI